MLRPDCFGIPAVLTPALGRCRDCGVRQFCTTDASAMLARLMPHVPEAELVGARLVIGLGAPSLSRCGAPQRPLSDDERARLTTLSKRAQPLAQKLATQCYFEQVRHGLVNNRLVSSGKRSVDLAMGLLFKGPVDRPALVRAFVEQLQLKPGAAQVEASTVTAALEFGRIARLEAGRLTLTPNRH